MAEQHNVRVFKWKIARGHEFPAQLTRFKKKMCDSARKLFLFDIVALQYDTPRHKF